MSDNASASAIVGFVLFAISEILPFLPLNTNGVLHSFVIGFRDSFRKLDQDIELAQQFVKNPEIAPMVNSVSTNPVLQKCFQDVLENQHLIPHIHTLCNSPDIQHVFNNINSNPTMLKNVTNLIARNSIVNE
jgi:hypothetical protein